MQRPSSHHILHVLEFHLETGGKSRDNLVDTDMIPFLFLPCLVSRKSKHVMSIPTPFALPRTHSPMPDATRHSPTSQKEKCQCPFGQLSFKLYSTIGVM